jgi:hypothetical protein
VAIHIQPLQGWHVLYTFPQVFLKAIHIQPLQGWHVLYTFPQVFLKAIISRSELLRFIFNPFGVGASQSSLPQVFLKAIHIQPLQGWHVLYTFPQVPPVAIHIQPLRGWGLSIIFTTGFP